MKNPGVIPAMFTEDTMTEPSKTPRTDAALAKWPGSIRCALDETVALCRELEVSLSDASSARLVAEDEAKALAAEVSNVRAKAIELNRRLAEMEAYAELQKRALEEIAGGVIEWCLDGVRQIEHLTLERARELARAALAKTGHEIGHPPVTIYQGDPNYACFPQGSHAVGTIHHSDVLPPLPDWTQRHSRPRPDHVGVDDEIVLASVYDDMRRRFIDFAQAVLDPENQPSQYGTTLVNRENSQGIRQPAVCTCGMGPIAGCARCNCG